MNHHQSKWPLLLLALMSLLFSAGIGHAESESTDRQLSAEQDSSVELDPVYVADVLYTCPMHPEVVTADSEAACPLCGMDLEAMNPKAMTELREKELYGCPMDPIVVAVENDEQSRDESEASAAELACPVCGMDLVLITHHAMEMHGEPGDHQHGEMHGEMHGEGTHHGMQNDSDKAPREDKAHDDSGHEGHGH